MEGAVADTHLRLARLALEPGVTHARTVHEADTVAGTLPRAPAHRTIHTGPANFADTRTLVADAVARALVLAGGDRAVLTFEAWVTLAGVAFADALEGAVVRADGWKLAGVTCKARIALANALVAVAVVVAVVRAR